MAICSGAEKCAEFLVEKLNLQVYYYFHDSVQYLPVQFSIVHTLLLQKQCLQDAVSFITWLGVSEWSGSYNMHNKGLLKDKQEMRTPLQLNTLTYS